MRPTLYGGPLLILLWQTAPMSIQQDPSGRIDISLGYGAGQYEVRRYSCAGDYLGADPHPFRSVTAHADVRPSRDIRLSGFAGTYSHAGQVGTMYGFVGAAESRYVGFGMGAAFGYAEDAVPSLYLRFGNIDRAHFRTDIASPNAAFPITGDLRIGIGFNQGVQPGPRGIVGVSTPNLGADGTIGLGPFLELTFPAYDQFGLSLHGVYRPSREYTDWALGIAGHYFFPIHR